MEIEKSGRFADILTTVVVFGIFLIIAGIFLIPNLTKAGVETERWGVRVDPATVGVGVDVNELQTNMILSERSGSPGDGIVGGN
ncbi:MAG: hypothetical protein JW720_02600 [Sedimentisphaerales bacterium]|nr:hypothetical protein [Sedimentisphaerales bacterium]